MALFLIWSPLLLLDYKISGKDIISPRIAFCLFIYGPDTISETVYFVYSDNEPFADAKHPPG